jgi:hypothetical protein
LSRQVSHRSASGPSSIGAMLDDMTRRRRALLAALPALVLIAVM